MTYQNSLKFFISGSALLFISGCAMWGQHSDGVVAKIAEDKNSGEVYFQLDPKVMNSCSNKMTFPYVIDTSQASGQRLLGTMLNAYAQKIPVRIESDGVCSKSGSQVVTRVLLDN